MEDFLLVVSTRKLKGQKRHTNTAAKQIRETGCVSRLVILARESDFNSQRGVPVTLTRQLHIYSNWVHSVVRNHCVGNSKGT